MDVQQYQQYAPQPVTYASYPHGGLPTAQSMVSYPTMQMQPQMMAPEPVQEAEAPKITTSKKESSKKDKAKVSEKKKSKGCC